MATKAMYPMNSSHYDLFFVVTVVASSRGHCPYVLRTSLGRKSLHDARNWLLIPCPDLLLMMPIQLKTESERKEERKEGRKELSAFLLPPMFFHLLPSFLLIQGETLWQGKHWKQHFRNNFFEVDWHWQWQQKHPHTKDPDIIAREYCFTNGVIDIFTWGEATQVKGWYIWGCRCKSGSFCGILCEGQR